MILNQLEQLPALPAVAMRVLQVSTSSDSCADDLVRLIESDQSLTGMVLKMVRKSSLGSARDIDTVDKAVVLLGFEAIRHAVLSVGVVSTFAKLEGTQESQFDRLAFWKHCLGVASAAHLIAERWPGHVDPEVAFVCGLLHDIGKVALDASLPKSYDRVAGISKSRHSNIIDVEQELLGLNHTVAGKRLAHYWRLPTSIMECAWLHHYSPSMLPDSVVNPDLVQIVILADTWVRELRIGFSGSYTLDATSREVAAEMGMPPAHLEDIAPLLPQRIEQRADLLGLGEITSGAMFAEAVANANLEVGRRNDELQKSTSQFQTRKRLWDLIHEFNCKAQRTQSLVDVCRLAAQCARELLNVSAVAVFTCQERSDVFYLALAGEGGTETEAFPHEADALFDAAGKAGAAHPGFIPAPPGTSFLLSRLAERLGPAPHWMVPIALEGQLWGGILFSATPDEIDRLAEVAEDMPVFAASLCGALMHAHNRQQSDRLIEGLAEVNRQLKSAQKELVRGRSLEMIADMAAGAAHELNNPLAVIAGRSELLAGAIEDEKIKSDLATIADQAHRCSEIVNELMAFAKPQRPNCQETDLAVLLERLRNDCLDESRLLSHQITLAISDAPVLATIDPRQVEQMFAEIINNSLTAMDPENAKLHINCRRDATDERVVVSIEDNGCGMSAEVLEKSRAPFFSDRPAGRGRGLGLSRAIRLCEINGGKLFIESQPSVGTRVHIEFPASA